MAEENVETVPKSEPGQPINLIIRDQHGQDVQFKVKPHIKFGKVRTVQVYWPQYHSLSMSCTTVITVCTP